MKILLTRAAATVSPLLRFLPPPLDGGFLVDSWNELSLGWCRLVEMLDNIFQADGGLCGR